MKCRIHQKETCNARGVCWWKVVFGYDCSIQDKVEIGPDINSQEYFKQGPAPARKRRWLYEQANHICYLCQTEIKFYSQATIDHIIPLSRGGKNNIENCKIAHGECNGKKGSKLLSELNLDEFIKNNPNTKKT